MHLGQGHSRAGQVHGFSVRTLSASSGNIFPFTRDGVVVVFSGGFLVVDSYGTLHYIWIQLIVFGPLEILLRWLIAHYLLLLGHAGAKDEAFLGVLQYAAEQVRHSKGVQ